jgi:hypothetical protein
MGDGLKMTKPRKIEIEIEKDLLGRSEDATYLTNYLIAQSRAAKDKSFVLNVNAKWGYGKTFLLSGWRDQLKKKGFYPLYFDAWKNDFSDDPFLSFISEIAEQLKEYSEPKNHSKVDYVMSVASKLGKGVLPLVGDIVIKQLTGKVTEAALAGFGGIDSLEGLAEAHSEDIEKALDIIALNAGKEFLASFRVKKTSVDAFKKAIKIFIGDLIRRKRKKTIFIFVDELDRCRPLFSIELLETIKHLFDIPNVVFVVATDTEQLGHSIRSVYGEGFGSAQYLKRFFDIEYQLSEPMRYGLLKSKMPILESLGVEIYYPEGMGFDISAVLDGIASYFDLGARDIEKIMTINFSVISAMSYERNVVHIVLIFFLAIVFYTDEENFRKFRTGNGTSKDIMKNVVNTASNIKRIRYNYSKNNGQGHKLEEASIGLDEIVMFYLNFSNNSKITSRSFNTSSSESPIIIELKSRLGRCYNSGDYSYDGVGMYCDMISKAGMLVSMPD